MWKAAALCLVLLLFPSSVFAAPLVEITSFPATVTAGQEFEAGFRVSNADLASSYYSKGLGGEGFTEVDTWNSDWLQQNASWISLPQFTANEASTSATIKVRFESTSVGNKEFKVRIKKTTADTTYDSAVVTIAVNPAPTPTVTPTPTATPTSTPSPTKTPTPTPTTAPTAIPTATAAHTSIPTLKPTIRPTATPTPLASGTPDPIPSPEILSAQDEPTPEASPFLSEEKNEPAKKSFPFIPVILSVVGIGFLGASFYPFAKSTIKRHAKL